MYQSQLLDAYKKAQNYVQDKQIAHDLNVNASRISEMRNGKRYISDEEAIFLAEHAGIDPEVALIGVHADRHENPQIRAYWERIAKKFNGLGLQSISMVCGMLALTNLVVSKFALFVVMLSVEYISNAYETSKFRSFINEVLRNDKKLCFS